METIVLNGRIGIIELPKYNDLVSQPDIDYVNTKLIK